MVILFTSFIVPNAFAETNTLPLKKLIQGANVDSGNNAGLCLATTAKGAHMTDLTSKHCVPCEGGVPPLKADEAKKLLTEIPGWTLSKENNKITREFKFKDFHETMKFVNAVADISNKENHHPDMNVGYNTCVISYFTHAIGGLSDNDFICAAKVNMVAR